MNTFTKLGGNWCVRCPDFAGIAVGASVTVTTRNGGSKQVTLGALQTRDGYGAIFAIAQAPRREAPAAQQVGDLSAIVALFDRARQHLRHPAIVLDGFRVNVAGQRARQPGSLTVTTTTRGGDGRRGWLGRVTLAGIYEPAFNADPAIGAKLRAFAADPAGQAAEYGRLHGVCCFCNLPLRDERSTAVGYGPVCADHFGLAWGARAAAAANAATVAAPAPVAVADAPATVADAYDFESPTAKAARLARARDTQGALEAAAYCGPEVLA